ncbi:hypothetical protein UFOVP998_48 [uncultured Caudovirales phage]|uniref:Uncharacterized protein n=1 Tax=uncultured Caudovirales phage TaxID=2100421 RepID=A0A6J5RYV0_9CAUD|nr:hypothetical protein UFOVP998_48 [uncultured Caudovirales phage]CAB4198991.1 hypothetical protein UFOVP1331_11 [uncultured Caudovirales phage]CAB4212430.1 hypothetical protein UFOVP1442_2 [uncultured Caudovirales phage]CAB5228090.1 hypothetical protein UFOVP1535_49 [uncultured Caudovirales phage]
MNSGLPLWVALTAIISMELIALALGFALGRAHGARQARIRAFHQCIDWAALAMKGHPAWRSLSADRALTKAGALIGGDDVVPPAPQPTVTQIAPFHYESAAAAKGHHV